MYIITSTYLQNDKIPEKTSLKKSNACGGDKCFYFGSMPSSTLSTIVSNDGNLFIERFLTKFTNFSNSINSVRYSSTFLNNNLWDDLIEKEKAISCIRRAYYRDVLRELEPKVSK